MSTLEKLFVQIFERKNGIIEQVKQQTDLYYKHLASKYLINGIPPPSWLWNPNFHSLSTDPKDLNKEELISELLFPHARHTIPYSTGQCSLYSKLVVTCDNGELLDGLPKVIQDSNKGLDAVDELTTVPESHGNDVGYTSNCVLQLDSTTPHGQADVGISNVCVASGQSPARFQRSQPVIAQNSGELSDGSLVKTHASNKCLDTGNELINVPAYLDNDPGCRSNCVLQSSPQDQTDVRISNIYKAPDQSLARIHRSKSRQKALELRTNAKAARKSRFSHENNTISFSGRIDLQEPDHANELSKMVKVSDINRGSFAARNAKGGRLSNEIGTSSYFGRITRSRNTCKQPSSTNEPLKLDGSYELVRKDGDISRENCVTRQAKGIEKSKENGTSSYCDRITRSKSSCTQHICLNESLELGRSSRIARKDGCTLAQPMANNPQYVSEVLEAVVPFDVSCGTSRVREAAMRYCEDREQGSDKYFGRITRSMSSSRQPSSVNNSVQLDASFYISKVDGGALGQSTGKSNQHLDKANEILEAVKPSGELGDRMKRSSTTCSSEGPSLHVKSSSIADLGVTRSRSGATEKYPLVSSLNSFEGNALKNVSGCKLIQPCPETDAIVNQEENVQSSVATELVIEGPIESYPYCFESNLDGVDPKIGSEGFIVRSTSDAHMDLKPKQLDFDNMENCDLNETFSPPSQNTSPEKSSQRICCNSLELATSLDKLTYPSNVSLEKQSIGRREASSETQEAWRPFEVNTEEGDENERNRSGPNMSENPLVNYAENDSEAFVYIRNSPALHEPDVALSDVCKSSDVDMRQLKCHLTEGCPELYIEEGHLCSESWNRSEIIPCTSQLQCSGSSLVSNLTRHATGDPKICLDKEVDTANPPDHVLDARRHSSVDDVNDLLLEHRFDCENTGNLTCTKKTGLAEGNFDLFEGGLNTCGSVGDPHGKDEDFGFSKLREPQPTNKFPLPGIISSSTKVDSWPRFKRRKVEDKQANCLSASPSFRVQKFHDIQKGYKSSYSRIADNNSNAVSDFQAFPLSHEGNVNKSSDMIYQKMECHITDGNESSPRFQIQEGKLGFEERIMVAETPSKFNHEKLGSYLVSSLSKQAAGDSQGILVEDDSRADPTSDVFAARNMCDEQAYRKFLHVENNDNQVNADVLTSSVRTLLEKKSHLKDAGQLFNYSVASPCNNDLAFDQTLPVFERFVLNEQTENGGLDISGDGINFGELNHSCTSTQRVSILEQICRTASRHTPLPCLSSTFKSLRTEDQYLSVNGLLERVEMKSSLPLSDDGGNHLRASFMDEIDSAFQRVSYSDCLPYSDARFGWNSKNSKSPPVGKFWERVSSNSFSSEKRLSFNPELTCFPIEEDPSVSEENENADDVADNIQEDIGSTQINSCAKREPLSDITEVCLNPPASVSAAEKCLHRGRFDSINTEVIPTTLNSVKQRLRNHCSNKKSKNVGKENQNLSVGANSIKMASESLHNRFSKAKLSGTTSMKRRGQRLSEKVKRNNIVSNITSFIPLVQQKQAAAVCTGKRDVKVRALEAAEAAKRLEEKRENERKMKKEALKLERAKIEQENLRRKELNKKKKEEELKKKDAEIVARKRLREEEEKKDKEKKKKRIEEGWRAHRAQEEKVRAGKGVKDKPCGNMGKKMNDGKESDNRSVKEQDVGKESGNEFILIKPETEPKTKQASIIPEVCDGSRKSTSVLDQSALRTDVATMTSREKTYEISPYQCSDNEEEEEEDLPTKKFVPSWASKNCVALVLSSQQQIDPSVIFPRESFCSMDEVLLPRNLR